MREGICRVAARAGPLRPFIHSLGQLAIHSFNSGAAGKSVRSPAEGAQRTKENSSSRPVPPLFLPQAPTSVPRGPAPAWVFSPRPSPAPTSTWHPTSYKRWRQDS